MNTTTRYLVITACAMIAVIANAQERMIHLNFRETPLQQVIPFYEHLLQTAVHVEEADYPIVTLRSTNRLTVAEAIIQLESHFQSIGIAVSASEGVITISPEPANMPADLRRLRYSAASVRDAQYNGPRPEIHHERRSPETTPQPLTDEEIHKYLQEFQEEVIRKGLPPPEMPEGNVD